MTLFFLFEETDYYRNTGFEASGRTGDGVPTLAGPIPEVDIPIPQASKPKTYLQKLEIFHIIKERPNEFVPYMYRPLVMFWTFPVVLWANCYHGIAVLCFNALNATASVILSLLPYNFSSSKVGLAYLSPTIGAVIG